MFKIKEAEIGSKSKVMSSAARNLKDRITKLYPDLEKYLDTIFPKKAEISQIKVKAEETTVFLYCVKGNPLFYEWKGGYLLPHLKLLMQYPFMMPPMQIDKGAIKHILGGANVMCPGLISKGGKISDVKVDTIVAIMAEGKVNPLGIGTTLMSSKEMYGYYK